MKGRRKPLDLAGAIVALSAGVLLPVFLAAAVGIVALAIGSSTADLVLGVLVVCFTAAAIGGAIVAVVLLGRRARLARLQSDLVANVTHELRTPLAGIRVWAQTLRSGVLAADAARTQQALDVIVRETEWLDDTIERMLSWRSRSGDRDGLELRSAPVRAAVEDAVERFRRMMAPGDVVLSVDIASERPVSHDRHSLAQVVQNLLVNAYKYTGDDKRIRVDVREAGDVVEIAVGDNGIGIAPKDVKHIFDPFFRVQRDAGGKATGAGLGLAIVRYLVSAHGGEIVVDSGEGRGSTFVVRLPGAAGGATT